MKRVFSLFVIAMFLAFAAQAQDEPEVVSITVSPDTVSVNSGGFKGFSATVTAINGASTDFEWSVEGYTSASTTINGTGTLNICADETAPTLTVKATSTFDNTKFGTATVTVIHYLIGNAAQLKAFADSVNNEVSFLGRNVILTADIDLSGFSTDAGWTPIGTSSSFPFRGNFDGKGHIITGLFINSTIASRGLFGFIGANGRVHNLGLENVNITGGNRTGGIAGEVASGVIENCYVTGVVRGTGASTQYVGAIAGTISGTGVRVSNCWSTAEIRGNFYFGGIVGSIVTGSGGSVSNCAALNPAVIYTGPTTPSLFGRIGYSSGSSVLSNNIAFSEMLDYKGDTGPTAWAFRIATGLDGLDITATAINSDGTLGGRFTSANGWTTAPRKLPGLGGRTVDMPAYLSDEPIVESVTVSPLTATLLPGGTQTFTANVVVRNAAPETVDWSVIGNTCTSTTISSAGVLTVGATETASTITVRATSDFDNTKSGTATVTVIQPYRIATAA